jgi:hypothetical protein
MGSEAAPEEGRDTMTGTAQLSDRDEAAAQAVARRIAALLKPDLAEILRQVGIINAKLDEMRALVTRDEEQHATMKIYQCECGYKAVADKEGAPAEVNFIDHLLEAFDPSGSNLGTDGQVHSELTGPQKRTCSCGFAAPDWAAMDAHLLAAFVTPDGVGADGKKHSTALPAGYACPDPLARKG